MAAEGPRERVTASQKPESDLNRYIAPHKTILDMYNTGAVLCIFLRMGNLQNGHSVVVQLFEQVHNLFTLGRVQVTGWFVRQDELWFVSQRAAEVLQRPLSNLKMVVLHLGNGVTMTAVDGGQAVDTTIGFATFSGVMMGTRSGDIDPGLIFHMHRELGLSPDEIERIVYKESGLLGVSGISNDMRVIAEQAQAGNERCQLAMDKFAFMAKKYLGAFAAAMGGLDCVVFTAGIGENSPIIRQMICQDLAFFCISLDEAKNQQAVGGKAEVVISKVAAGTAVLVIPTNEEKMIALDTKEIAGL